MHLILEDFHLKIESECVHVYVRTVKNAYGFILDTLDLKQTLLFRCDAANEIIHSFCMLLCLWWKERHQIIALNQLHILYLPCIVRVQSFGGFHTDFSQCRSHKLTLSVKEIAVKRKHVSVVLVRIYFICLACLFVRATITW